MYNPYSLQGKTILVTGASSGIGRATAIECSRMMAKVCITGRNKERLQQTFEQLEGEGHMLFIADLTDSNQAERLVDSLPKLDGIVHSAGVIPNNHALAFFLEQEEMIALLNSNLMQIINMNAQIIKNRKLTKGASIVHISSLSAKSPIIGWGHYAITKGALVSYSKSLATEVHQKKIRVNSILPAMIDTDYIKTELNEYNINNDRKKYPFGYGQPEDVAWMCIYLLSDAARWITGGEFEMDGGRSLQ